ncbi:hypothetical protein C8R32_12327 [Nitrosospira sp. Nsp5]|uniref:Uncharacterized protein n=1 Tax=Nitrosospira multiformis TaxID=1231 RepID=A0ABY0TDE6_9PROT|nr:hypothetical protein C8R32_12327 [Nitrosospira sp. Nsp5]SDQ66300.1 hypothetical protein SAMN05216402_1752 [Nitrosospira multiformis]
MAIYAIYTRTKDGAISRDDSNFEWDDQLGPYMHEEQLTGWPESKVFWRTQTGYTIGLAPTCASRSDSSELVAYSLPSIAAHKKLTGL